MGFEYTKACPKSLIFFIHAPAAIAQGFLVHETGVSRPSLSLIKYRGDALRLRKIISPRKPAINSCTPMTMLMRAR